MKKNVALVVLLVFVVIWLAPGCATRAPEPRSGLSTGPGRSAAVVDDLIKLLPRSTTTVIVLDVKRFWDTERTLKFLHDLEAGKGYDEYNKMIDLDPKEDIDYVGIGLDLFPAGQAAIEDGGIIISLRYDRAKLQGLIKDKAPWAKEEIYSGVPIYSNLGGDKVKLPKRAALLDASHIVLGTDEGIKAIIDVYQKKAEPLAKNPEMTVLLKKVDRSGFAWGASSIPPELIEVGIAFNPLFEALEGVKGLTVTFGDKTPGLLAVDVRTFGGTKEQNTNLASILNGLKAVGAMSASQEPLLGELLKGIAVTSGEDYTRLSLTLSLETMEKLGKLAESKAGDLTKPEKAGRDCEPEKSIADISSDQALRRLRELATQA